MALVWFRMCIWSRAYNAKEAINNVLFYKVEYSKNLMCISVEICDHSKSFYITTSYSTCKTIKACLDARISCPLGYFIHDGQREEVSSGREINPSNHGNFGSYNWKKDSDIGNHFLEGICHPFFFFLDLWSQGSPIVLQSFFPNTTSSFNIQLFVKSILH